MSVSAGASVSAAGLTRDLGGWLVTWLAYSRPVVWLAPPWLADSRLPIGWLAPSCWLTQVGWLAALLADTVFAREIRWNKVNLHGEGCLWNFTITSRSWGPSSRNKRTCPMMEHSYPWRYIPLRSSVGWTLIPQLMILSRCTSMEKSLFRAVPFQAFTHELMSYAIFWVEVNIALKWHALWGTLCVDLRLVLLPWHILANHIRILFDSDAVRRSTVFGDGTRKIVRCNGCGVSPISFWLHCSLFRHRPVLGYLLLRCQC